MLGAISTTLIRLLIARKNLLQWTTAANAARSFRSKAQYEIWSEMAASLVFAILLGVAVAIFNPSALWVALPFLVAWLVAPQSRLCHQPACDPCHHAALGNSAQTSASFGAAHLGIF